MNLRVTYSDEKELENFKKGLELIYDIVTESSSYPMRKSKNRRKYFKVSIKQEKIEQIRNMM